MTEILNFPISSPVELVRRYGGPVSHAALDPSHSIFRAPGIDGLIGFLVVHRCAVVLGDPICDPVHNIALANAFSTYCSNNGWSIIYSTVTATLHTYARERSYASIEFANLLMANPQHDPEIDHQGHHLRQHLNHVRRAGVMVREYLGETTPDARLEAQVEAVCEEWLEARQGIQMYLGRPRLFNDKPGRRWFIAERAGKVVGMLSMLRMNYLECHSLINILFSSPAAPLYTNELMIISALQALREEEIRLVCFGVGPLKTLGRIDGLNCTSQLLSRSIYRLVAKVMNLHDKTLFWEKYHLVRQDPLYLIFQSQHIGLGEINALFRTFHFSVN